MKAVLAGLIAVTACKSNTATTDDAGAYGGGGRGAAPGAPQDKRLTPPPPTGKKDCSLNNGTAKVETNAPLDTSCAAVLGLAFTIGAENGMQLSLNANTKPPVETGVTYVLKGDEVVTAFFNKEEAEALKTKPILMATFDPYPLPADKGKLGLGNGTVTFRALPAKGKLAPFAADFDIKFEATKLETVGGKPKRVKTGVTLTFKGSIESK